MPHTYNGIGTWYYGKKNVQTRPGVCEFCRREATLSSYDTRLWVVIFFIPVIPIGSKHIINSCPKCRRHRVLSLAEWEKIKGKNLSDATAAMQANPQDAQAAIKLHSSLMAFGQVAAADKLAALMQERFANDAAALAYLGSSLQFHGRAAEALPFYQQALKLNPDLPEAKVFFALDLLKKGQVDEAHKLLKFLEAPVAPGATQYPGALFALASAYQKAGRDKEALPLFDLLVERFPKFAQDKKFRAAFRQAESAAGRAASRLPARQIRWKPIIALGVVVALALVGALFSNYYISQHQTLYLVSGTSRPVTIQIAGRPEVTLGHGGMASMQLPEGAYHAVLDGAIQSQMDFRISSSFWGRWSKNPVNILNAGGTALLVLENTTYAARHDVNSGGGRGFSFYFGQPFLALPDVDYPFQDFPASITLDSQSASVQKSRIYLFEGAPKNAFFALTAKSRYGEAFPLAEWALKLHPDDNELLAYYVYFGDLSGRAYACRTFLAQGAKRRPVEIPWHRAYQESFMHGKDALPLIAEYDSLLKNEPDNSALQYLRGRLSASRREGDSFYQRAIALDPKNAFAHYAFAGNLLAVADWTNTLPHLTEAIRLQPAELQFQQSLFLCHLAAGKLAEAETLARNAVAKDPADYLETMRLGTLFVLQNKTNELEKLTASFQRKVESVDDPQTAAETMADLRSAFLYAAGDFAGMEKLPRTQRPGVQPGRFAMLVELGRLQEAADFLKTTRLTPNDWVDLLALSAAWKQAGNDAAATSSLDQAVQLLSNNRLEDLAVAEILKRGQPASLNEIMDIPGLPIEKAMLLVVQAQRFPKDNAGFLAVARRLNFTPQFPSHLIDRLAARTGPSG